MSLQQIWEDLSAALHDGAINLESSTVPGIEKSLAAIGISASQQLSLTSATLERGPASVSLTGNARWRTFDWAVTLTGEEAANDTNSFTLVLQGLDSAQPWSFSVSFPELPETRLQDDRGALVLAPSVIAPLVVEQPRISASGGPHARLEGWLALTSGALQPYAEYFGAGRIRLDGQVDLTVAIPTLDLRAVAGAAQLPLSTEPASTLGVHVNEVGLRLQSDYPDIYSLEEDATMSAAVLYAALQLGSSSPVSAELSTPLLQSEALWPLNVSFANPVTLGHVMSFVLDLLGQRDSSQFSFPLAEGALNAFGLTALELGVRPPLNGRAGGLSYAALQLQSTQEWDPPVPFLKVRELGTGWVFHWYTGTTFVTGNVWGKLTLFEDIELIVTATIPDFDLTARTEAPISIPLAGLLEQYLGGETGLSEDLKVTEVLVEASPTRQTYHGTLLVDGIMLVKAGTVTFSLDRIIGELRATQTGIYGSVAGFASIQVPNKDGIDLDTKAVFSVQAEYRRQTVAVWSFEGGLADGTLSLLDFAWGLFGARPSPELPTAELTELWLTYSTAAGEPYSARGELTMRWEPELFGLVLSLSARARYARRPMSGSADRVLALAAPERADPSEEMIAEGELYGTFTVNQLAVTAGLSFVDKETVYLFEVAWGSKSVRAITQTVPDSQGGGTHQALAISLNGLTLGGVVEELINLANPNLNYHLEAPWSVLNSIDLSRFTLVIDPTLQTVAVTYDVSLALGFMTLSSVGLLYDRSSGEGSVRFIVSGELLGERYEGKDALSWDAAKDAPPEIPGKGPRLFELRYLGMGQHVTLDKLTKYDSVSAVLGAMRSAMPPLENRDENPLSQSRLQFEESSQWMLGLDCTAMDTVTLGVVLHDPDLYGLVISLAGPESGSLAGLSFELLYKRVTDTIGVFRVRLQIPDAYRQIELGAVSVTLGVITVDVFTNGDFLVDLGFPHKRDFSASFGLQAGPFIGSGGIYFGLLDGATSQRVPAITNGSFDPVLELGVGISAGVGRTFEKGPLSAGLYVQMVAIVEGVLGWFHPADTSAPKAMYYWGQGSAGLVGKLYGSVDFKVIRVSVSVEAHATVTVTFAAYEATVVELDVGVEVNAEIEILFISISFHFSLQLNAEFTIGEPSTPPWTLAAGQGDREQSRLLLNVAPAPRLTAASMRRLTHAAFLDELDRAPLTAGEDPPYELHWQTDIEVFPDHAVHPITVKLLPAYTLDQVPVRWPGDSPASESDAYRIAFLTLIDNGVPPGAPSIAAAGRLEAEHSATARTGGETAFNVAAEAMLRWALSALGLDPVAGTVSAGQLHELARQLDMAQTMELGFTMKNLSAFFVKNLEVRLSAIPSGTAAGSGASAFPIPPALGWDSSVTPETLSRRFTEYGMIDSTYESEVAEYFSKLEPRPAADGSAQTEDDLGTAESMATFVFRDWFLLVAKAAVQSAIELMAAYPYPLAGPDTEALSTICGHFPAVAVKYQKHSGDTVEQVAATIGISTGELLALNPQIESTLSHAAVGAQIEVLLGATPEGIAAANPQWPLTPETTLELGDIVHHVGEGETLAAIAAALGAPVETWLATPALLDAQLLLKPGAPLAVPAASFANPGALDLVTVAALLYVRLRGTADLHLPDAQGIPLVQWYAAAIAKLNAIPLEAPLPAELRVPQDYDQLEPPRSWAVLAGDTLWGVAATTALAQHPEGDPEFGSWLTQVRALNPGSGPFARVMLPAAPSEVHEGETLRALAARLPLELPDTEHQGQYLNREASFRKLIASAPVLSPLQPLLVPGCSGATGPEDTLAGFAQRYDLAPPQLGSRLASHAGLLAPWPEHELSIPHPGSAPIGSATVDPKAQELVPAALRTRGAAIAAQASRFMMHGLRMGAPQKSDDGRYHPTGPISGLFELTGQQLPGPAPSTAAQPQAPKDTPGDPATDRMALTVKVFGPEAGWLKLYDSVALTGEEPLQPLLEHNPALAHRESTAGIVALTDEVEELVMHITDADLANYPARKLEPIFDAPPSALDLSRRTPVRHGLQQRIVWQSTETIALPNPGHMVVPAVGTLTVWPFASDLRAAALAFPVHAFTLLRTDPALGPSAEPVEFSRYAWATTVELGVRQIAGQANTYELLSADAAGREALLGLWRHLLDPTVQDSAKLHLLSQPPASTGLPNGLASVTLEEDRTFLVKTNLSTVTVGPNTRGQVSDDPPTYGEYYARIADAARFLTLLWEGSVVGGSGYWLRYTGLDGAGLPDSVFAADGTARLSLLALLATQTAPAPSRTLYPFTNCAVVGESIDASTVNVFAEVAGEAETRLQATVAPGNVAFGVALKKPPVTPPGKSTDKQVALRRLYSLVGYSLRATDAFTASAAGMPVGPQVPKVAGRGGAVGDEETWDLFQVVPVHRFALHHSLPEVLGLPAPNEDPYAGVVLSSTEMGQAEALVSFQDVLGNASLGSGDASAGGPSPIPLPVGYTDPVLGVGSWPATTSAFQVLPAAQGESGALLSATLALQASAHLAGPGERGSAAALTATRQRARFTEIYYQVMQPDVKATLLTTLEQLDGEPAALTISITPLRWFASASCAWLQTAGALEDLLVDTSANPTLNAASSSYGVGLDQLAGANLELTLAQIFAAEASIPEYVPFRDSVSVAVLCPQGTDPAKQLAEPDNAALPLRAAVELVVPQRVVQVPPDPQPRGPQPPARPPSLRDLASANGLTLASLVLANELTPGLLRAGTVFACEGIEVEVLATEPDVSLEHVAQAFAAHGVPFNAVMVAGANAELAGPLRPGAQLKIERSLTLAGETLAANHTGVPVATLARENVAVSDLFPAGTPLLVGTRPAGEAMHAQLGKAAAVWGLAPQQLLRHNATAALLATSALAVPGQAALPADLTSLRVPYRIPRAATLAGIGALFVAPGSGTPALALATANLNMPGVLATGQTIEVDGQHVQTREGDALADALARFQPPVELAALVDAIDDRSGYLAAGALLLCPPALLPSDGGPLTPRAAGERYGLDAAALASANAALAGIVAAATEVALTQPDGTVAKITAGASDTLNSLVWRFALIGVTTTVAAIAAANETVALLRAGARILLAPAPVHLSAKIGAGSEGFHFPAAIFPLQAWLALTRESQFVDTPFRGPPSEPGPVVCDRTLLAPAPSSGGQRGDALALERFARAVQKAVSAIRVATGKVAGQEGADVWAVVFDATHIAKVALAPAAQVPGKGKIPQFYALQPLSNSLMSRAGVPVSPLEADGTLGPPAPTDYQGVDLESWAQRVLADIDLFVSAPYATAAYSTPQRAKLEAVLAAKSELAGAIAQGLDYVLELGQPQSPSRRRPQPPDWLAATETLRQQLLLGLAAGYGTAAIVQFRAEVNSPWSTEQARLSGSGKLPSKPTGEQQRARISGAKTSLASGSSYVDFLVSVASEGHERAVELPLEYVVGELEFDVSDVVSGYQSSDWLSLVTPFAEKLPAGVSFELGTANVPLPLRAYPPLPTLLGQNATASTPLPQTFEQALHWDYRVSFQHQSMASDQLKLEVELNRAPSMTDAVPGGEDLFTALARYVAVAPGLWEILALLPDAGEPVEARLGHAIETFATLVDAVAKAWTAHWSPAPKAEPAKLDAQLPAGKSSTEPLAETRTFTVTLTPSWNPTRGRWYWSELVLSRDGEGLPWPQVGCFESGGAVLDMGFGEDTSAGRRYAFPDDPAGVEAFGLLGYELRFPELHIASRQNALARIQVLRNAHLIDGGPPTRAGFVYQTPVLAFPSTTSPLLSWTGPFSIGEWVAEEHGNPLTPVFSAVFDGDSDGRTIGCAISYGYEMGGSAADPLVTELPVAYRPSYTYEANTVQQIVEAVKNWQTASQPASAGGEWVFGLSLFSSVDGQLGRPLLELRRLRSRI